MPSTEDDYALSPTDSEGNGLDEEESLFADQDDDSNDSNDEDELERDDESDSNQIDVSDERALIAECDQETNKSKFPRSKHDVNRKQLTNNSKGGSLSSTDSLDVGHIGLLERLIRTHAIWLLGTSGRSVVTKLLIGKPVGSFIVRASSKQHTMALSVRLPAGKGPHVEHYLIEELAERKLHLEGSVHYFSVLPQLISHYCQCADELPVQLRLPEPLQTNKRTEIGRLARLGAKFWETLTCDTEQVNAIEPSDRGDSGQPPSLSPVPPPPPPHHNRSYLNERALMVTADASPPPVPPKGDALNKKTTTTSLDDSLENEEISPPLLPSTAACPPRPPRGTPIAKNNGIPPPIPSRHTKPASKSETLSESTSNGELTTKTKNEQEENWSFGGFEILAEEEALIKRLQEENDALDLELLTASTQRWFNQTIDLDLIQDQSESRASADQVHPKTNLQEKQNEEHSSGLSSGNSPAPSSISNSGPASNVSSCLTSGFASGFTSGFGQLETSEINQPLVNEQFAHQKISFSEVNGQHKTSIVVNQLNVTSITISEDGNMIESDKVIATVETDLNPIRAITRSLSESPNLNLNLSSKQTNEGEKKSSTLDYSRRNADKIYDYEDIWTTHNETKEEYQLPVECKTEIPISVKLQIADQEDPEVETICSQFVTKPTDSLQLIPKHKSSQREQCSPFYCEPIDAIRAEQINASKLNSSSILPPPRPPRQHFGSDSNLNNTNFGNRGESNSLESLLINFRNCIYESWPNRSTNSATTAANQTAKESKVEKNDSTSHTLRIKLNELRQLHARAGSAQSGLYGCKPMTLGNGTSGQPDMCWQVDSSWRWQSSDDENGSSNDDDEIIDVSQPNPPRKTNKLTKNKPPTKLRSKKMDSIDRKLHSDQLQPYRRYSYRYVMENNAESETEYESSAQVRAQVQQLLNENNSVVKSTTCSALIGSANRTLSNQDRLQQAFDLTSSAIPNEPLACESTNESNVLEDWNDLLRIPGQMQLDSIQTMETDLTADNSNGQPQSITSFVNSNLNSAERSKHLIGPLVMIETEAAVHVEHQNNDDDDDDDDEDEFLFEEIGLEDDETNDELDDIYEEHPRRRNRNNKTIRNNVRPFIVEDPYMARNQLLLRSECGRQLADYITKLAEQSDNTFSQSIDRFVRCTVESKETSGRIVMRNIRQFMSGLKNYLGKHGEKDFRRMAAAERSRLLPGEFLNMDAIIEGSLHLLVLRPLRDHIYSLLQQELTENGSMQQLRLAINRLMNQSTNNFVFDALNCTSAALPSERYLAKVKRCLHKLSRAYSPLKKLEHLLAVVSLLQASIAIETSATQQSTNVEQTNESNKPEPISADRLIRPLAFALVHSQFFEAELECEYMWSLLQPALLGAEGGYYLSTLSACVHALKQFGNKSENGLITSGDVRLTEDQINSIVRSTQQQRQQRSCSNSSIGSNQSAQSILISSCIRVLLPDELSGQLQKHMLPLRISSTCRDAVRLLAHRFKVHASDDYALMKLQSDGNEQLLNDIDCPLQIQSQTQLEHPEQSILFVFKRRDAHFIWPHLDQL